MAYIINSVNVHRFGHPIEGHAYFWRQVLLPHEVIRSGDIVFTRAAAEQCSDLLLFRNVVRTAEREPNSAPPRGNRQYTTIDGWDGQYTLEQMLAKTDFIGGFIMRRHDKCESQSYDDPYAQDRRMGLVALLPPNTHFSKPLPLP